MNQIANQIFVRKVNTVTVLETLRSCAPLSRADLAEETGLNRSTVSSIIQELLDLHFVRETSLKGDHIGRPSMPLELNPEGGFAIGLEINVDYVSAMMADFSGATHRKLFQETNLQMSQHDILQTSIAMVTELVEFGRSLDIPLFGIGIGLPGVVDIYQGKLIFAPNLGWRDLDIGKIFSTQFNVPICVENEANCGALGELRYGIAREVTDFIYISAGVGLGGGIMINGELLRGNDGFASEIGHMVIYGDGNQCSCGRKGCWETYVGPRAVIRQVVFTLQNGTESQLHVMLNGNLESLTFKQVVQAAEAGDTVALKAIREVGTHLGVGIINLVNIFNPEQIILGGALSDASALLIPQIKPLMDESILSSRVTDLPIVPSSLGADACLKGAMALVFDQVIRDPLNWLQ
jgi:glucokinase-like ROK family protein